MDGYAEFSTLMEVAGLSPNAVIIYTLAGNEIIYSNAPAVQLLGLKKGAPPEAISALFQQVIPEDKEYARNMYSNLMKESVISDVELHLLMPGQTDLHVCCNAYLVNERSVIVAYVADITKPRKHEDYLVEFGARKDTVLDTLTHHMSGALNLMKNLFGEIQKLNKASNDSELSTYLKLLDENNSRCLKIIDDLINNEHERSPAVYVKNARIDIVDLVAVIHSEYLQSYKNRTFRLYHAQASLYISTDEVKVLQVVNNLISNAIKFSMPEDVIEIHIADSVEAVIISVRDFGIGIPENLWPFIFQRQPGAGRTGLNGEKSTELGLSICKNLVDMMGGRIWFESEEGEGSTFYFSLPKKIRIAN